MSTNEQQTPEHPPRPTWNAREMAIVLSLGLLLLSVAIDFMVDNQLDWRAFLADLPPNIVGALIVFWMFEWMYSRRQQEEQKAQDDAEDAEQLKRDLIVRMGSQVKDNAVSAVEVLQVRGWLTDGSLYKAELWRANLQEANLVGANLQEALLIGANLQRVNLFGANLQEANLVGANLQWAFLDGTILQDANLAAAELQGANLGGANLQWANLQESVLNGFTTLPDGTRWTPDTDLTRFTDPKHPDFWRPDPGSVWWYPGKDAD